MRGSLKFRTSGPNFIHNDDTHKDQTASVHERVCAAKLSIKCSCKSHGHGADGTTASFLGTSFMVSSFDVGPRCPDTLRTVTIHQSLTLLRSYSITAIPFVENTAPPKTVYRNRPRLVQPQECPPPETRRIGFDSLCQPRKWNTSPRFAAAN